MCSYGPFKAGYRFVDVVGRRVHSEIVRRSLLPEGSRVLVAVSGGQDSLALAEILRSIQAAARPWISLGIAHTDHGWPGDAGCAEHVARYARGLAIPLHVAGANGTCESQSEAAARTWRYSALADIARRHSYSHVAVGHTQSDLAETLLFNLVHGAGADGLASLTWLRDMHQSSLELRGEAAPAESRIMLVRPLLSVSRAETAALCAEQELDVWNDVYNSDPRYARFRTREHILPYLRTHYNRNVEEALARTAQLLRDESIALESFAADAYRQSVSVVYSSKDKTVRTILVRLSALRAHSVAIQRRVMRRVLTDHTCANGKTSMFKQVEALIGLIEATNGCSVASLPGGATARLWKGVITLSVSSGTHLRGSQRGRPFTPLAGSRDGVGEQESGHNGSETSAKEFSQSHDEPYLAREFSLSAEDSALPFHSCRKIGVKFRPER